MHLPRKQSIWTYLHQKRTKTTWTDYWCKRRLTTKAINRICPRFCGLFFPAGIHVGWRLMIKEQQTIVGPKSSWFLYMRESSLVECFIPQAAGRNWNYARHTPPALNVRNSRAWTHTFHVKATNRSVSGATALHACSVNVLAGYHFKNNTVGSKHQTWYIGSCITLRVDILS